MRAYSYEAIIEPGETPGILVVTFPDVPEAITEGDGRTDALARAEDALASALLTYPRRRLPLPPAGRRGGIPSRSVPRTRPSWR